jgi:hypothetical protein
MRVGIKIFVCVASLAASISASAGLVTQYTSVGTYQRDCPGLSDPNYLNNWGSVIESFYGLAPGELSTDLACHFNGGNQKRFYNNDGTPINSDWGLPDGVPFSDSEAGDVEIIGDVGTDYASVSSDTDDHNYYAEVLLDADNLGLPQIKVMSDSDEFERNSVNGIAATEYLWTGAAQTLEYTVNFDFFASGDEWTMDGGASQNDYVFILEFGAATDMEFEGDLFPSDWGNNITSDFYNTNDYAPFDSSEDDPFEGSLTVSFDVETGDRFFLYGFVQAFGYNGGFVDAAHTVTSELAVSGLSEQDSLDVFSTSLQAAPPTSVPEPSTFMLSLIALVALVRRK